jgi:hypothetical protein
LRRKTQTFFKEEGLAVMKGRCRKPFFLLVFVLAVEEKKCEFGSESGVNKGNRLAIERD